jgi:hypothetical protein
LKTFGLNDQENLMRVDGNGTLKYFVILTGKEKISVTGAGLFVIYHLNIALSEALR